MRRWGLMLAAVFISATLIGCAQKQISAQPEQAVVKPSEAKKSESVTENQKTAVEQEGLATSAREIGTRVNDIHFAFDKYDLDAKAKETTKELATLLSKTNAKVVIEGNCDERGTKEYNLALGDKRTNAAKQYLISLGIPSTRIDTISYGKEKPICTESTEECWAKNRTDHFVLTEGK
jgi:peptidoglycan-associated lipoprotein